MSLRHGLLATAGIALFAAGSWMIQGHHSEAANLDLLTPTCRVPLTMLEPASGQVQGSAVVLHGLASNRRLMLTLGDRLAGAGLRVFLVDSPGHGDSPDAFSYARAEECAAETVETLARDRHLDLSRTVLLGHSMGGAIAIRLADQFPTAATIAISPAPMQQVGWLPRAGILFSPPRRMPINLLLITGGLEPSVLFEANEALLRDAGGERTGNEDFAQKRAAMLDRIPGDAHTSLVFDPRVARRCIEWALRSLGLPPTRSTVTTRPELGSLLGLLGLILLFPAVANLLARICVPQDQDPVRARALNVRPTIWHWMGVSVAVVLVLQAWVPLGLLRILTGDYYASFKLLAGVVILLSMRKAVRERSAFHARPLLVGGSLGLLVILATGAWLNWQITDLWMNAARWLRFVPVVVAGLPFYFAEELALGSPGGPRGRRWLLFIVLRLISWAAMVGALIVFSNGQILILLLGLFLAVLAIAQRLGADAVRRRTGSAMAAALFSAILGAWFVAAVLPLT